MPKWVKNKLNEKFRWERSPGVGFKIHFASQAMKLISSHLVHICINRLFNGVFFLSVLFIQTMRATKRRIGKSSFINFVKKDTPVLLILELKRIEKHAIE